MSLDAWDDRSSEPDVVDTVIKLTGTGAAQPTKVFGRNVTLNRTAVGIIDIAWVENPGAYVGLGGFGFEATVQSGLKGYTVVAGVYSVTTRICTINITSNADALVDLTALQQLTLIFKFKRTNA